jgi:hypothetical protein
MKLGAVALLLLLAEPAALDVDVAAYRQAGLAGEVGVVSGHVWEEPRTRNGSPRPFTGTTITLLPRSQTLVLELERLKERARQSSPDFTAAAPAMRAAQEGYERALLVAGAPDLSPRVLVATDGTFRLPELPAGAWLVLAWYSTAVNTSAPRSRPREQQLYQLDKRLTGYQAVTVWLQEVSVARGQTADVELTDRNEWFRGVIEEKVLDTGR